MKDTSDTQLRIKVQDMPPREERTTDSKLEQVLKRISGREGSLCERNCDCGVGFICREGKCTKDW